MSLVHSLPSNDHIAAPSFRVCTADQIKRTKLRPAYRRSTEAAAASSLVTLVGWLAGGIGIGALALVGIVSLRGSEASTAGVGGDVASQVRVVTVIDVGPAAAEGVDSAPVDFEIPDEPPPRAVAKQAKRRPVLERRSPY